MNLLVITPYSLFPVRKTWKRDANDYISEIWLRATDLVYDSS